VADTVTWSCNCEAEVDRERKAWRWITTCDLHLEERDDLEYALECLVDGQINYDGTRVRTAVHRREPPPEKACRYCGQVLPVEAFFTASTNRDGLSVGCKDCIAGRLRRGARRGVETARRRRERGAHGAAVGDVHGGKRHPGG